MFSKPIVVGDMVAIKPDTTYVAGRVTKVMTDHLDKHGRVWYLVKTNDGQLYASYRVVPMRTDDESRTLIHAILSNK